MSQPRPALRRAADADVHPALVVVPDTVSSVIDLTDGSKGQPQAEPDRLSNLLESDSGIAEPTSRVTKEKKKKKKAKAKSKAKKNKSTESASKSDDEQTPGPLLLSAPRRFRGAGRATSDALVTSGKKQATLKAQIPRPLRTELREAAKASGVSTDTLLTEILGAWFTDPDRW